MNIFSEDRKTDSKTFWNRDFLLQLDNLVVEEVKKAIENHFRIMYVFSSEDSSNRFEISKRCLLKFKELCEKFGKTSIKTLFVTNTFKKRYIDKFINEIRFFDKIDFEIILFRDTKHIMGQTYDFLFLDLSQQLNPNDLGRIIETVQGGGVILILAPSLETWQNMRTELHKKFITPPYTLNDIFNRFNSRFIRKIIEHDGIHVIDVDKQAIIEKKYTKKCRKQPKLNIPSEIRLAKEVYHLAATNSQIKAINTFENLISKDKKKSVIVMTANRGRGKSAAIGIGIAGIADYLIKKKKKKRVKVDITSPEIENVQTLFEFASKCLKKLSYEVHKRMKQKNVYEINSKRINFSFKTPMKVIDSRSDFIAVDESAGVPIPVLTSILTTSKGVIYSSTVHGYEGAGRNFSIRFLNSLRSMKGLNIFEIELVEPIRYSENDPIEAWLYDTLLLDAETEDLSRKDLQEIQSLSVKLEKADLDQWFLDKNQESNLKKFVGVYIYAHYRNNPNDVAMLADSPHHEAWVLKTSSEKIVNAIQTAQEGSLDKNTIEEMIKGLDLPGNIIPSMTTRYFQDSEFPKLKGLRIVRIATHPKVMSMGLGSKAIHFLIEKAIKRKIDWIGACFEVNEKLMKFWFKNEFLPIHISPSRSPVSGEYSIIVIKPLSEKAKKLVNILCGEFKIKFVEWARDLLFDMNPIQVLIILETLQKIEPTLDFQPRLSEGQIKRLKAYCKKIINFEMTDGSKEIARAYFLDPFEKPNISEGQKLLLISRCLQGRNIFQTTEKLKIDIQRAMGMLRKAIKKLLKYYVNNRKNRMTS